MKRLVVSDDQLCAKRIERMIEGDLLVREGPLAERHADRARHRKDRRNPARRALGKLRHEETTLDSAANHEARRWREPEK